VVHCLPQLEVLGGAELETWRRRALRLLAFLRASGADVGFTARRTAWRPLRLAGLEVRSSSLADAVRRVAAVVDEDVGLDALAWIERPDGVSSARS